ncbi:MAG: endonuclease MutS2 [Bacillota bacterium]
MDKHSLEVLEYKKIIKELANYASTNLAKEIIKNITPNTDLKYISKSLKEVSVSKILLDEFGRPPFGGLRDLRKILKKANKDIVLNTDDIGKIQTSLKAFRNLKNYFNNIIETSDPEIVKNEYKIMTEQGLDLVISRNLENDIDKTLDEFGEIKDSASSKLKSIRRNIEKTENQIRKNLENVIKSKKYENMLQESIVTKRENRYVVPVKQEYRSSFSGIVHDQSSSGMTVFMEPMSVVKSNNKLRELKSEEEAEIYYILEVLTNKVRDKSNIIENNLKISSMLDVAFARAKYSQVIDGIAPELNKNGEIFIKKGRHPLLKDKPVPIDVEVGKDFETLVITGPNTGGKTVSLKTIGLFTLMTSAGLHIPAERGTIISLFDEIYADIGDEQSIEQNLSTFSSHMNKIKRYLKRANENSLILLDELGVGTDPKEGAALGIAILEKLKDKGAITVATTHYSQLKSYAYSTKNVENASVEFDIETLSPTYRLIMGVPGGSNAFEIALRLGLPEDLIEKAKELSDEGDLEVESIIGDLNSQRKKYRDLKNKLARKKRKVDELKSNYKNKLKAIESKEEKIINEAQNKAEEIVKKAKKKSKKIIKDLKDKDYTSKTEIDRMATKANEQLKKVDKEFESKKDSESKKEINENLEVGDRVRIMSLGRKGNITFIDEDKKEAKVQAGAMKINVGLENLNKVKEKQNKSKDVVKKYKVKKSENASQSLDLRGKRYVDAQNEVDKYLDDAFLAGYKKVEIIHGKGTGALREAVHEKLENHPHVASFRLGKQKEGGSGVTIVTLGN